MNVLFVMDPLENCTRRGPTIVVVEAPGEVGLYGGASG